MDAEITPEPTPLVREAVVEALDRLLEADAGQAGELYRSAWRLAGLRENTSGFTHGLS